MLSKLTTFVSATVLAAAGVAPAQAAFIYNFTQVGSSVIVNGTGTINVSGLSLSTSPGAALGIRPSYPYIVFGASGVTAADVYNSSNPFGAFGADVTTLETVGTGNIVGLDSQGASIYHIIVPTGYVSSSQLTNSATFANATFASLGLTAGTTTYSFGTGANADTFTVQVGPAAAVPELASWAMMIAGMGAIGFAMRRRQKVTTRVAFA